jgi:septum formation protein
VTLVLASGSAGRLRVLRDAGLDPEVVVSGVDETTEAGLSTAEIVGLLAERKASAVAAQRPEDLVLGCDSLLQLDQASWGKPESAAQAAAMWRRQSGREGTLWTGHCLIDGAGGRRARAVARATVRFGAPSDAEIAAYTANAEPLTTAGAFSVEGLGAPFVDSIDGHPSTVMGLSLPVLRQLLAGLDLVITDLWRTAASSGRLS